MTPTRTSPGSFPSEEAMMSNPTFGRPIEILLVEDNRHDARRTLKALREGRVHNRVHHVWDGEQAMAFLRQEGEHADAPLADLVLLDLHLPCLDGREVLQQIKEDPGLRRTPVVILTASDEREDILAAYDLHVNCYLTKPVDADEFIGIIKKIEEFWLTVVKLPSAA
jgi:chemotaxis family two-component system response regulator Rcp1